MKYSSFFFILTFAANSIFSGCKQTSTSTDSFATGEIIGNLTCYDTLGLNILHNQSGFKVSLDGTSFFTFTDSTGKWDLKNIPTNTYVIVFSKDNYGIHKEFNLQVVGSGILYYNNILHNNRYETYLFPLPSLWPNIVLRSFEDSVSISKTDTTILNNEIAFFSSRSQYQWNGQSVYTSIYFGKSSQIDPLDPSSYIYSTPNYPFDRSSLVDSSGYAVFKVLRSALLNSGFTSGENVFCCVYAGTQYSVYYDEWTDPLTGKEIQSGFSPHHSEVKSFILP